MPKIFVVCTGYYEDFYPVRAFSSPDDANLFIKARIAKRSPGAESAKPDYYEIVDLELDPTPGNNL